MSSAEVFGLVLVVVLAAFAAVLAVAETAFTHVSRARAEALADESVPRAGTLIRLLERRERVLNPVLLTVLACQLGAAMVVGALVQRRFGVEWVALSLLGLLVLLFVFTEALPKAWALQHPDRAALRVAPLVGALGRFPPLRWTTDALVALSTRLLRSGDRRAGPAVTEEELVAFAAQAVEASAIEASERKMIESVLELGDTVVREIMTPRPDMVVVQLDAVVSDALDTASEHGLTRLPVFDQDVDDIVGLVHAKDLVRVERAGGGTRPVRSTIRPTRFVPETKRADELLQEMQAERFHLAVVVDEYGGTAGLVTLEDVLEELIGEIVDEFDVNEPLVEPLVGGSIRVHGRMPVYEVAELIGTELPEGDWDTIGGLIFNTLGHLPEIGETLEVNGLTLRVEHVEGRRITRVRITPAPRPSEPAPDLGR